MIISYLNHLEDVSENILIQGTDCRRYYQNNKVKLKIKTNVDLTGNSAATFADAVAVGDNSFPSLRL